MVHHAARNENRNGFEMRSLKSLKRFDMVSIFIVDN